MSDVGSRSGAEASCLTALTPLVQDLLDCHIHVFTKGPFSRSPAVLIGVTIATPLTPNLEKQVAFGPGDHSWIIREPKILKKGILYNRQYYNGATLVAFD